MKKLKPEKPFLPTSISAKKTGSLRHEALFTPVKVDWKNTQSGASSQTSSRTFFNSMKNDLYSLKNEVERMIKKETVRTDIRDPRTGTVEENIGRSQVQESKGSLRSSKVLQPSNGDQMETSKFDDKNSSNAFNDQINHEQENIMKIDLNILEKQSRQKQNQIEILSKQNRLQKNLITELKKQNHELYTEMEEKVKNEHQMHKELQNQRELRINQNHELISEVSFLKQKIKELEQKNIQLKQKNQILASEVELKKSTGLSQIEQLKKNNEELRSHNSYLQQKIEGLSQKMSMVTGRFKQKDHYIKQLETKIEALRSAKKQAQIQYEQEKKQIDEQWTQKFQQRQSEFQQKLQQQLKNSQKEFIEQIQYIELRTKEAVEGLEEQNLEYSEKIKQLQQQIQQKASNAIIQRVKHQKSKSEQSFDFGALGAEFQRKINELIEQNYELKNKITELESQIQSLKACKQGIEQQLRLYQELEEDQKAGKAGTFTQFQKAVMEIHSLKKQKESIVQEFEYKIMKLENQIEQERNNKSHKVEDMDLGLISGANFNKILKEQLQENQELKEKLKEQTRQLNNIQNTLKQQEEKLSVLNQQLAIEKIESKLLQPQKQDSTNSLKLDLQNLKKKYEALNSMLDTKNKQIRSKDEFIEKVLISKAGKKQEQEEIAFILKELKIYI